MEIQRNLIKTETKNNFSKIESFSYSNASSISTSNLKLVNQNFKLKEKIKIKNKYKTIQDILMNKYKITFEKYHKIVIENLLFNKNCHIVATFKDNLLIDCQDEFLKRVYILNESKDRILKIGNYCENYQNYFAKPYFKNCKINIIIHYYALRAEHYFRNNLIPKKKNEKANLHMRTIFNSIVKKNIEKDFPNIQKIEKNSGSNFIRTKTINIGNTKSNTIFNLNFLTIKNPKNITGNEKDKVLNHNLSKSINLNQKSINIKNGFITSRSQENSIVKIISLLEKETIKQIKLKNSSTNNLHSTSNSKKTSLKIKNISSELKINSHRNKDIKTTTNIIERPRSKIKSQILDFKSKIPLNFYQTIDINDNHVSRKSPMVRNQTSQANKNRMKIFLEINLNKEKLSSNIKPVFSTNFTSRTNNDNNNLNTNPNTLVNSNSNLNKNKNFTNSKIKVSNSLKKFNSIKENKISDDIGNKLKILSNISKCTTNFHNFIKKIPMKYGNSIETLVNEKYTIDSKRSRNNNASSSKTYSLQASKMKKFVKKNSIGAITSDRDIKIYKGKDEKNKKENIYKTCSLGSKSSLKATYDKINIYLVKETIKNNKISLSKKLKT